MFLPVALVLFFLVKHNLNFCLVFYTRVVGKPTHSFISFAAAEVSGVDSKTTFVFFCSDYANRSK